MSDPLRPGDTAHLRTIVEFRCPFCNGVATASERADNGNGCATHTVPTCSRFDALEPAAFVRAARIGGAGLLS